MQITNTQKGPRGLNAVNGAILVDPGATVEVEVYAREREGLEASDWFTVQGEYTPDPGTASAGAAGDNSLEAANRRIAELEGQVRDKDQKIADLTKPVLEGPFEAKEKSPGWFAIFDGKGNAVGKSFREDHAKAFNSLDDAAKLKAVEEASKAD